MTFKEEYKEHSVIYNLMVVIIIILLVYGFTFSNNSQEEDTQLLSIIENLMRVKGTKFFSASCKKNM